MSGTDASPAPPATPLNAFEISPEDASRFLAAKWKAATCDICHETGTWSVGTEPGEYVVLPVSDGANITVITRRVIANFVVFCKNCGNVKLLLAPTIAAWVRENAPNG